MSQRPLGKSWPCLTFPLRISGFSKGSSCICNSVTSRFMSTFHLLFKYMRRKTGRGTEGREGGLMPVHSMAITPSPHSLSAPPPLPRSNVVVLALRIYFLLAYAYLMMSKWSIIRLTGLPDSVSASPMSRTSVGQQIPDRFISPDRCITPIHYQENGIFFPLRLFSLTISLLDSSCLNTVTTVSGELSCGMKCQTAGAV